MPDAILPLSNLSTLLERSKELPPILAAKQSFLEICGFPHYEQVASNLLAFFLDPAGPHQLGSLTLSALLGENDLDFGQVFIERKIQNIDLVVYSDSHLIGIENKIFHSVTNPFDRYAAHLVAEANGRQVEKILLIPEAPLKQPGSGFRVLLYATFIAEVRRRLAADPNKGDPRYRILMDDFLTTMDNLQKVKTSMTPEHMKFFRENAEDLDRLVQTIDQFKKELKNKISDLRLLIDTAPHSNVRQTTYQSPEWVDYTLVHQVDLGGKLAITVDAKVDANGWHLSAFSRRRGGSEQLKAVFKKLRVPYDWEGSRCNFPGFEYDDPLSKVQAALQTLLHKLAGYRGPLSK